MSDLGHALATMSHRVKWRDGRLPVSRRKILKGDRAAGANYCSNVHKKEVPEPPILESGPEYWSKRLAELEVVPG